MQKLCKKLGIKVLPFMEIVAGEKGKVESFTCGASKVSLLVGKLEEQSVLLGHDAHPEPTDIEHLLPPDA